MKTPANNTLHLPRILCLHRGGVNAEVFRLQSRTLISHLKPYFRLCFVNGPFVSEPGPDMLPTFKDFAPFRYWLQVMIKENERMLKNAMSADNARGATGDWVGLIGFSQGAKMCASLLYRQQMRAAMFSPELARPKYRFGVLLAGRPPLVALNSDLVMSIALADVSKITTVPFQNVQGPKSKLRLPTCNKKTTELVEWDGDHRVPNKTKNVAKVVKHILYIAKRASVSLG
ncbi:serine hydrolase FSH [Biscogniauxia sp. FL1348]|nr:serine hydrolase FSH [Biscogniauxia sp. FL1348]